MSSRVHNNDQSINVAILLANGANNNASKLYYRHALMQAYNSACLYACTNLNLAFIFSSTSVSYKN